MVVGQEIELSVNFPNGTPAICSQSWSSPNGGTGTAVAVGGYTASNSSAARSPLPTLSNSSGTCNLSTLPLTFYWVDPGNEQQPLQITYTYTTSGNQSASATATFNLGAPTGVGVSAQIGQATVEPTENNKVVAGGIPTLELLGVQVSPTQQAGILFQASGNPPSGNTGAYSWVQLVKSDVTKIDDVGGSGPCTGGPSPSNPELDTNYPYKVVSTSQGATIPNDMATDNPQVPLKQNWGEAARSFEAIMYLMWTPNADSRCTGSTCTIPVPLGSVNVLTPWQFGGDTINTLSAQQGANGTTWKMNFDGQPPTPTFQRTDAATDPSNGFPTWGPPSPYTRVLQCP